MAIEDDLRTYEALMERLTASYRARILVLCKHAELTPPQFWALKTIHELERTKMSPLADQLGLSLGAASTLVDRLVTRGLVERTTDAHDRRAVYVSASTKGRDTLAEVMESKRALTRQVFEHVLPDDRQQLLAGLAVLTTAWEALPPVEGVVGLVCAEE
jgi:DNA-binding MarR family transcriptional regulator